jgi:hypothetical protein
MENAGYQIIFRGALAEGADPAAVKRNLATLFKTDESRIEALFSGKAVVIKNGVDRKTALAYQAALKKAGALCEIREQTAPPQSPAPAESEPNPPGALEAAGLAPAGSTLVEAPAVEAPVIDTSGLGLAPQTGNIVEHEPIDEPEIDTGKMSLGLPGEDLVEHVPEDEPDIDTETLGLAPPGGDLGQAEEEPPRPPPDTRHLHLE